VKRVAEMVAPVALKMTPASVGYRVADSGLRGILAFLQRLGQGGQQGSKMNTGVPRRSPLTAGRDGIPMIGCWACVTGAASSVLQTRARQTSTPKPPSNVIDAVSQ
jgi:hypothetical protein